MTPTQAVRRLSARPLTDEAFRPYGRVIRPAPDGTPVTEDERQLDFSGGQPRFYMMELADKAPTFRTITRHRRTTQSLLAVGGGPWFLAVAPPSPLDLPDASPNPDDVVAFAIPADASVLLYRGTWHSGPFFTEAKRTFANLELADTNVVDHHTVNLGGDEGLTFEITTE